MKLRIGCAPDVPLQRLQGFLGQLYSLTLEVELEVTHLPSAAQLARLRRGELDVGLIHDPGPVPGIEAEPVYRGEELTAVVAMGHRLAAETAATLEDLAGEVLLTLPREAEPGVHSRVVGLAAADGAAFRDVREAAGSDVRDLVFAVASADGVTVGTRSMLRAAGELAEIVAACSLGQPAWMPDTCLAWSSEAPVELGEVIALLRDTARDLYRSEPGTI